jgi:hypothetical protein
MGSAAMPDAEKPSATPATSNFMVKFMCRLRSVTVISRALDNPPSYFDSSLVKLVDQQINVARRNNVDENAQCKKFVRFLCLK